MEIKRLKDNQIRCALTEEEIEEMGFCIDDIIGNNETTQHFMQEVLEKIKEQEGIDTTLLSPMVRAELLQDHSMTITFGGITEEEKRGMFDKIMEMMEQMAGKSAAQKENNVSKPKAELKKDKDTVVSEPMEVFPELPAQLALELASIGDGVRVAKLFEGEQHVPQSALYKLNGQYYLLMELSDFSKQEIKPLVIAAIEYQNQRIATESKLAYIKEHGKCILKQNAISDLIQLL